MTLRIKVLLVALTLSTLPQLGLGQEAMEAALPENPGRMISLQEVVNATLDNNMAYRIARINPEIANEYITSAEAAFDSELFASGRLSQSEQNLTFTQTTGTSSDSRFLNAGVRKRLVYGTTLTAQTNLDRRDSNAGVNTSNLSQSADLSLSLRQPLLSGFGRDANMASVETARAGYNSSVEQFREASRQLLANTERAYWIAARWQDQLVLDESNLEVAESLLAETKERRRVGLVTNIEVLQAEAARAQFLERIILDKRELGDALDSLFTFMGVLMQADPVEPSLGFSVQPLPDSFDYNPEFAGVWQSALAEDPILASQEAVIAQREWERINAKSNLKPNLDLVLSGAFNGVDNDTTSNAVENALARDGHAWAVGLEFSMPWGRRGEKADLLISESRIRQENLRFQELKQSLYQAVRRSWRNLESVRQSYEAAKLTVSLQEATFEREMSKYEGGLSVFRNVTEAQRDLDQARIRLLQSKYALLSSEIEIARLTGQLLERHGLTPSDVPTE